MNRFQNFVHRKHKPLKCSWKQSQLRAADPGTLLERSASPAPPSFPDGVQVLHECADAEFDLCFIHGLTGNRESTWTADGQSAPWPQTLLPSKLHKARILTYGYDADVVRKSVAGNNRLLDHATNLLTDLTTNRASCNASTRPLIFVAHSLGGLVCKQAILLSRNNPEDHLQKIFKYVKGIMFMGTPHKGSWMSDWANIPATALGFVKSTNKSLLTILETNDQLLEAIQVQFSAMIRELRERGRRIEVTCFFEELPLPVVGKVVSKSSAIFEGYNSISIHGNHSNMVKFGSAEDNGFKRLLGELQRWATSECAPQVPSRNWDEARSESNPTGPPNPARPDVESPVQGSTAKFLVPYNENKDFIERPKIIEQVKQQFGYGQPPTAGLPRSRVSLYGLGGIGKTQIALSYVYWLRETHPEISVFWVHASSAQRFHQAYTSIAQAYSIPGFDKPNVDILALVKGWLEQEDRGRWLMAIDNADDMQLFFQTLSGGDNTAQEDHNLARYIPECRHGSVLVTTRNKQAGSRLAQGKSLIEVGEMDQSEANQLVRSLLQGVEISTEEISDLSSRLQHLPLALAQAAAFIHMYTTPVSEYIQLLDSNPADVLDEPFETVGRDWETPHAVTETWMTSFKQIERQDALASDLLSFMSLLDRQAIPRGFVDHYCEREQPEDSTEALAIHKALGTLKAFCFISEAKDQNLDMHRLVQLVTRKWLIRKNTVHHFAEAALKTVSYVYPDGDYETWQVCSRYLPHAYAVLGNVDTGSWGDDALLAKARLQRDIGCYYMAKGWFKEAEKQLTNALDIKERLLGKEHPDTLIRTKADGRRRKT
ncbi:hypothetical protein VMCG_08871 [Cytospora schulzeri]|uniref:DUF676 domain-containing protein n=1 Tax=Cytospora schulzeri TaxID=448051 RepID=A0A423VUL8_9PEZI|nr:hypothetical protein VMCG_08871 [Valsa malicola]